VPWLDIAGVIPCLSPPPAWRLAGCHADSRILFTRTSCFCHSSPDCGVAQTKERFNRQALI